MNAEKICFKCHVSQPLSNFHNRKYVKDGKVSQCKSCIEKKRQKRLKDNPEKEAKRVKLVRERAQQRNRKFVYTYLQSHPCVDCGIWQYTAKARHFPKTSIWILFISATIIYNEPNISCSTI